MNKKVCVVGGGRWGKNHLKTLEKLGSLGGLVEQNLDAINHYKEQYTHDYLKGNVLDHLCFLVELQAYK